jgi:WD40 repeat protein
MTAERMPAERRWWPFTSRPRLPPCVAALLVLVAASGLCAQPPARTDAAGDPLPPGAVARLGTGRLRSTDAILDLAFTPDGTRLAATSADGRVTVWDAATGRLLGRTDAGFGAAVAFGPDGRTPGTFAPGVGLQVFQTRAGVLVQPVYAPQKVGVRVEPHWGQAVDLAPGLRWLTFRERRGERSRLVVMDPATGREPAGFSIRRPGREDTPVVFSADGSRLAVGDATAGSSSVRICDPATAKVVFERRVDDLHERQPISLSRDGSRVAVVVRRGRPATDVTVQVWEVTTGKLLRERRYGGRFDSATLSPDGATVIVQITDTLQLIDVATGEVVREHPQRRRGRMAFAPDGRTLAVFDDAAVEVIDLAGGRVVPDRAAAFATDGEVSFRRDGTVLVQREDDHQLEVWNPRTGRRVEAIPHAPDGWYAHALSPDRRQLIDSVGRAGEVGEFRLWDRVEKQEVARSTFPGLHGPRFVFAADGRLFLHTESDPADPDAAPEVCELDPTTLRRIDRHLLGGGPFLNLLGSGRLLSADGFGRFEIPVTDTSRPRGTVRQWNLRTGAEGPVIRWAPTEELADDEDRVGKVRRLGSAAVSGDGRWLAVLQFIGRRGPATPDGRDRETGDAYVTVFDATDGRERVRFPVRSAHADVMTSGALALSANGRLTAVYGFDGACRVYETFGGTERRRFESWAGNGPPGTHHTVKDAAFSPDGRLLLTTSSADGGLVWDVAAPAPGVDPARQFGAGGVRTAWEALAAPSAEAAYPALVWLAGRGNEAVTVVQEAVGSTAYPTPERVAEWRAQLGAPVFADREDAERRLRWAVGHFGGRYAADLRRAVGDHPNPEVRRRLARALAALDRFEPVADDVRAARAVEVLERIGSPAAQDALAELAAGPRDAWVTRDARAALARLQER